MTRISLALLATAIAAGCAETDPPTAVPPATAGTVSAAVTDGLVVRTIPEEDPGPPFYARVGYQYLHDGGLLAIPFYRSPGCIPSDFNLLDFFHFPGPGGPGAFACPLLMGGHLLIEPDAAPGTFPAQVVLEAGSEGVPFVFVEYPAFQAAAVDGVVTMAELDGLDPVRGTANRYHETLHPREGEHKIIIDAAGHLEDGRAFRFHATHIGDVPRTIRIDLR